jgi:hypothetical protein
MVLGRCQFGPLEDAGDPFTPETSECCLLPIPTWKSTLGQYIVLHSQT